MFHDFLFSSNDNGFLSSSTFHDVLFSSNDNKYLSIFNALFISSALRVTSASLTTNLHFRLAGARLSARRNVTVSVEPEVRSFDKTTNTLAISGVPSSV